MTRKLTAALYLALLSVFLSVPAALAQEVTVSAPTITVTPAPADPASITTFAKMIFSAVKDGNWWTAAAAFLVLVVTLIRLYGKKVHEMLDDNNPLDKVFWFLLDTKPGGWLLNFLTAVTGGTGAALLAGEPITWALLKPILMVSLSGAALWELASDIMDWWKAKNAPPAAPSLVPPKP